MMLQSTTIKKAPSESIPEALPLISMTIFRSTEKACQEDSFRLKAICMVYLRKIEVRSRNKRMQVSQGQPIAGRCP